MQHKSVIISAIIFTLLSFAVLITLAQEGDEPTPAAVEEQHITSDALLANVGTGFTYQGYLEQNGAPVDNTCDFLFKLYDADYPAGTLLGGFEAEDNTPVTEGYFTVSLNESEILGTDVFNGEARWLQIHVRCPGGGGNWDLLLPRQQLTATPYALALPGLWTQQNATSPNLIGGYNGNVIGADVTGSVISGGGNSNFANSIFDDYGTIGGGANNVAGYNDAGPEIRDYATVGGGLGNTASTGYTTVGGGLANTAGGDAATVGGGSGNIANNNAATVSGGNTNLASGRYATVGGGLDNVTSGQYATVGGGSDNLALANYATIAGGGPHNVNQPNTTNNRVYDDYGTIGGGAGNIVGNNDGDTTIQNYATVSGGLINFATSSYATVSGGYQNNAAGSTSAVVGGAVNTANGDFATVSGGFNNTAAGTYSFAAGRRAQANHSGAFVWADSIDADFASTAANTFNVRAGNGVRIETNNNNNGLQVINNGADGVGLYAENSGSGKDDATLRANNNETSGGVTAYLTNNSNYATVHAYNGSDGEVLYLQNGGDSAGGGGGDFIKAVNEAQNDTQFRVTTTGEVYSDIGFNTPAADFAEMLPAVFGLEPGDVLAIGGDGRLIRTTEAYQPTVVGVYSTQPGFVGGMPVEGEAVGKVPLAVVGVVPVKVSAESGAIQPGDMLTASSTPGHAMKALSNAPQGTVIGKALEPLKGDTGVILMLVILQ